MDTAAAAPPIELGLDTFGDVTLGPDGQPLSQAQVLRHVVEEAVLADRLGLSFFGVGEHHRADFAVSAPEVVLAAIAGSPYLPDWDGAILFLEDVSEDLYRVDRMMTTLALAGILDRIRGFVFGTCSECEPGEGYASLTLEEILNDHIKRLKVPAWHGAMIGHRMPQFTMAEGIQVEIDATAGRIRMLEPAVA